MLTCDQWIVAGDLPEALDLWSGAPEGSRLVAGATDTLPWARQGRAGDVTGDVHVPRVIDISALPELAGWSVDGARLRLGANLVFESFLEDRDLAALLPIMPHCAVWFADDQIRRQATLAGNVVNASPAADGMPALIALSGELELARRKDGKIVRRRTPVDGFVTGPGNTAIQPGEIVTGIFCDSAEGYGAAFEKVGHRRSLVISVACVACLIKPSADGERFDDVRIALAGVGPVPARLTEVEERLRGQPIEARLIAEAALLPTDRVASRSRREYRRDVVRGFVERALLNALADSGVTVKEMAHV